MHIPDGMISPSTAIAANLAMLPVWWMAGKKTRENLKQKEVPLLAICSAFCFTIMMFNVPALGGTTAHAVGSTLIAIMLGPWAAIITVTVALVIQATFFADGGILAIGANSFTMAFVEPLVGYLIYRALSGSRPTVAKQVFAAGFASYVAIALASTVVAILLGIQPALFHNFAGKALYFPFGLKVTLAGIVPSHLLIAGPVEAIVTTVALRFAIKNDLLIHNRSNGDHVRTGRWERFGIVLLALLALSPLGLLASGAAWGEWDATKTQQLAGYVPKGVAASESHGWKGLGMFADYASDKGPVFYILAGLLGVFSIALLMTLFGFLLRRKQTKPVDQVGENRGHSIDGLPSWLVHDSDPTQAGTAKPKKSNRYAEKSLEGITNSVQSVLSTEEIAQKRGALQAMDPRLKTFTLIVLAVTSAWVTHAGSLSLLFLLGLVLASASKVPLGAFLGRVWLTAPLFIGIVALPATLNVVTPGKALWVLSSSPYWAITYQGLNVAGILIFRSGVSLTFAMLIAYTTRWHEFLRALRSLGVPKLFLMIVSLSYRYLQTLLKTASEMFVARRARTIGRLSNRDGRGFIGGAVGTLFGKSIRLSEDVHAAMVARGYSGEIRTSAQPRIRLTDFAWSFFILAFGLVAAWLNAHARG